MTALKFNVLIAFAIVALFGQGCRDDVFNEDSSFGEFVTTLEDAEGNLFYFSELKSFAIRYHLPGTIDSFYTGILCTDSGYDLEGKDFVRVRFSGSYYDDKGKIQPMTQLGGEEFFFLDLTQLEELE